MGLAKISKDRVKESGTAPEKDPTGDAEGSQRFPESQPLKTAIGPKRKSNKFLSKFFYRIAPSLLNMTVYITLIFQTFTLTKVKHRPHILRLERI